MWVIFALLDPDPDPDSEYGSGSGSTYPIEYGSNTDPDPVPDPDPQPCFEQHIEIFWKKVYLINFIICLELIPTRFGLIRIGMP